jgi:hypothetical protein
VSLSSPATWTTTAQSAAEEFLILTDSIHTQERLHQPDWKSS